MADALYALVGKGGKDAAKPFTGERDGNMVIRMQSITGDGERPTMSRLMSDPLSGDGSFHGISAELQAVLTDLLRAPQETSRRRASSLWHNGAVEGTSTSHSGAMSQPNAPPDRHDSNQSVVHATSQSQLIDTLVAADNNSPPVIQESALKASVRRLSNLLTFGGRRDDGPQQGHDAASQSSRQGSGNNHTLMATEPIAPIVVEEVRASLGVP